MGIVNAGEGILRLFSYHLADAIGQEPIYRSKIAAT
jgi:hypothetical protein